MSDYSRIVVRYEFTPGLGAASEVTLWLEPHGCGDPGPTWSFADMMVKSVVPRGFISGWDDDGNAWVIPWSRVVSIHTVEPEEQAGE